MITLLVTVGVYNSLNDCTLIVQNRDTVVIDGETPSSEAVTAFAGKLGERGLGTVRLVSLEQDRERRILIFRIEIMI